MLIENVSLLSEQNTHFSYLLENVKDIFSVKMHIIIFAISPMIAN